MAQALFSVRLEIDKGPCDMARSNEVVKAAPWALGEVLAGSVVIFDERHADHCKQLVSVRFRCTCELATVARVTLKVNS